LIGSLSLKERERELMERGKRESERQMGERESKREGV